MTRREFFVNSALATGASLTVGHSLTAQGTDDLIYLNASLGADSNPGTKTAPLKSLAAAARKANALTSPGSTTIVLEEGIYAVNETAVFKPSRPYSAAARLTIRAAVLPDDDGWHHGRMPTLIQTMPLDPNWNGRPDRFGGAAFGMSIETSHVTVQGLKILGMPVVERPTPTSIWRAYPIGRMSTALDDLLVTQCLFAGDEVTNPHHLALLVNGTRLVVDHCVFHKVKQTAVFQTPGSTGHAMRNCLIYDAYAAAVWTSSIATDFDYRNNIVTNSNYVWIGQSARTALAENGRGRAGGPPAPATAAPRGIDINDVGRYQVRDSLFAGNRKFTGSGGGPALNFQDNDPSFLELINTPRIDQAVQIEWDQAKRSYLHAVAGSDAARIGAGLFKKL